MQEQNSDESTALVINATPAEHSKSACLKATVNPALSVCISAAATLPYAVITAGMALENIFSTVCANFLVNAYAANASLHYLQKLSKENKKQLLGALFFAMLTSLPITFIGYDESKQPTEKMITAIAAFFGTSIINLLSLSSMTHFCKENFTSAGRRESATLREQALTKLLYASAQQNGAIQPIPLPILAAGKISEYGLKIISASSIMFCAFILTSATEKSLRDSIHLPDNAAFSVACALMLPIILLCAITGWNVGDTITRHIANLYQTGNTTFESDKKAIIAATVSGAFIASLSGSAIKKLQTSDAPASCMHALITFPNANIAAVISATLFNIYHSALALLKTYQFIVEKCCQKSREDAPPEITDAATRNA